MWLYWLKKYCEEKMHTFRLASAYLCIIRAIHIICCSTGLSFVFAKILIWIEKYRTHNRKVLRVLLITNRMNAVIFLFSERPVVTQKLLLRIFGVLTFEQISWGLFLVYNFNMRNLALLNWEWPAAVSLLPKPMASCPPVQLPMLEILGETTKGWNHHMVP